MDLIVTETNRYADSMQAKRAPSKPNARILDWKPLTIEERRKFIGITIIIGCQPKVPVVDFWKKPETPLESTSHFGDHMSRNRYKEIDRLYTVQMKPYDDPRTGGVPFNENSV